MKEDIEARRQAGVEVNGHSLRKLGRTRQIPFRCTPAERALLVNLARALKCNLNDVLLKGLHTLEKVQKGKPPMPGTSMSFHGCNKIKVKHHQPDNANSIGLLIERDGGYQTGIEISLYDLPAHVTDALIAAFGASVRVTAGGATDARTTANAGTTTDPKWQCVWPSQNTSNPPPSS